MNSDDAWMLTMNGDCRFAGLQGGCCTTESQMLCCSCGTSFRLLQGTDATAPVGGFMMWAYYATVESEAHGSSSLNTGLMIATC
jgi:hypothetical protein